jgi:hypothetical protein
MNRINCIRHWRLQEKGINEQIEMERLVASNVNIETCVYI